MRLVEARALHLSFLLSSFVACGRAAVVVSDGSSRPENFRPDADSATGSKDSPLASAEDVPSSADALLAADSPRDVSGSQDRNLDTGRDLRLNPPVIDERCAQAGQACCPGSFCGRPDLVCRNSQCVACGNAGQSCCTTSSGNETFCSGGDVDCLNGSCQKCGGLGQPCCTHDCLDPDTVCGDGSRCVSCGLVGQPCCVDGCQQSSVVCNEVRNRCETCGNPGQVCCDGSSCNGGGCCVQNRCVSSGASCPRPLTGMCTSGSCGTCGGAGQICCPDGVCTASRTICGGTGQGTCQPCGGDGQACCEKGGDGEGGVCGDGLGCDENKRCTRCGGENAPCCAKGACNGALVCDIGEKCVPCGGKHQPCCAGSTCSEPGNVCAQNVRICAEPCGGLGASCCPNRICVAPGTVCTGAASPVCIPGCPEHGNGQEEVLGRGARWGRP